MVEPRRQRHQLRPCLPAPRVVSCSWSLAVFFPHSVATEPLVYTYTNFSTISFSNQGLLAKEAAYKLLHTLAFRAGGMGVATINKSGVIVFRMRVLVIGLCHSMKHDIALQCYVVCMCWS